MAKSDLFQKWKSILILENPYTSYTISSEYHMVISEVRENTFDIIKHHPS